MKRVFLFVGVLLALGAPGAQAGFDPGADVSGPSRPFGEAELAALAKAETYWGQKPALCTSLTLKVVYGKAFGVAGAATLPEEPKPCGMWIAAATARYPPDLCTVVRHEYGHLLGLTHRDPELIRMKPCFDRAKNLYWRLVDLRWHRLAVSLNCIELSQSNKPAKQCWAKCRRITRKVKAQYSRWQSVKARSEPS